jgi:2-keto-3-deoxy-L-rhamnonate aldolase RhmA
MRATEPETPSLVRVAAAAEGPIKQALDVGATGVIVPQVNAAARILPV